MASPAASQRFNKFSLPTPHCQPSYPRPAYSSAPARMHIGVSSADGLKPSSFPREQPWFSTGITYVCTKHWIANNMIGIAIAITGIEYLHFDRVINGCILLGGLFVYDIFWVFGTGVMVCVATNFEAPVKVAFPRDFLTKGIFSKDVGILGLGDIVIPGIFIAILLRFDVKLNRSGSRLYFWTGYIAYIIGLLLTFVFMYTFHQAPPALLYLVPTCLGFPMTMALVKGDYAQLMAYKDIPKEVEERIKANKEEKEKKKE
ncbi:hypothetical protein Aperf_G00000114778 [Anoplocephala perfoliata]